MSHTIKSKLRERLPWALLYTYRKLRALPEDLPHVIRFLYTNTETPTTFRERARLVCQFYSISYRIDCPHMENEMLQVTSVILAQNPKTSGVIVEAGSYKGGSTAKLSLVASLAKRTLYVFDSFEGIPENTEMHGKNIYGGDAYFPQGSYRGSIEEVRRALTKYGSIGCAKLVKGWFNDTMPRFKEPVLVAYVDVDLESSTRTCLVHLYPLLVTSGTFFSQDGHLPNIIRLLRDPALWDALKHYGTPYIEGLGTKKLVGIRKT